LLPLINAAFDYLSIGLTRWLIGIGTRHSEWAAILGLADLLAAGLAFTGLGCSLIAAAHLMNGDLPTPVVDLPGLFHDLRDPQLRADYIWVYAMIFSTLLPTLLHLMIAVWSFIHLTPRFLRRWVLTHLPHVDETVNAKWGAAFGLTLIAGWSIVLPLLAILWIGTLLYEFYPQIGGWYLWFFEWFAQSIGVPIEPVPPPTIPV